MKILIIDDIQDNLVALQALIRIYFPGCETATADSGLKGLEMAISVQPDTILLDIHMPEMDGFQACQLLKSTPAVQHIPVIFLTAQNIDSESRIRGLEIGGDAFLTKPVEPRELAAQIRALLRLKLAQDALRVEKRLLERMVSERTADLTAETANLNSIFDSSPVAMIVVDQDRNILRANAAAVAATRKMQGQDKINRFGDAFRCVHSVKDPQGCGFSPNCQNCPLRKNLDSVISGGAPLRGVEISLDLVRNGVAQTTWLKIGAEPIVVGGRRQIVLALDDITEMKQIQAQYLRAQRMESIGTLASGVAHDLNNVLAPILMSLPLLRQNLGSEDLNQTIDALETSVKRGAQIIKQLLAFGRGLGGERVLVQLFHLIKDLKGIAHETFPKNIALNFHADLDLWLIICDPTQCHQALLNLCINSRDAMPDGGVLLLKAENYQVDESFAKRHPDAKPGPYIRMLVSDTGTGIAPENIEKIFDPFFTTKDFGKGTGLGLATVAGIVKTHGGFLTVTSVVGHGTNFEVFLPASPEAHAASLDEDESTLPRGSGETILVVDDEKAVRQMTQGMLLYHGYQVLTAKDGNEGLALFEDNRASIKVILTDYMMPELDGLGLIQAVRQSGSKVKVIFSSGLGDTFDDEKKSELLALDVNTRITKPFSAGVLLMALDNLLHNG